MKQGELKITIDVIARDAFHDRFMHSADIFRGGEHVCKIYTWNIKRKPDDNAKLNSEWLTEWFRKITKTLIPASKIKHEDIYFMRVYSASLDNLLYVNQGEIPYYLDPDIIKFSNGKTFFTVKALIEKYGDNYETTY